MIPYFVVLFFILIWIMLEKYTLNRKAFWIPLITLSLFAGIRSNSVGTDSPVYTSLFQMNFNPEYYEFNPDVEIGYQYFEYFLLNVSHNYFILFIISAFFICFCYLKTIKTYSYDYVFSIFLFLTLGVYTLFFNTLRQGMAIAIFVLALPYLLNKKFIPYCCICVCASLMHISALFMIPFYFMVNVNIKGIYKLASVFLVSLISSQIVISHFAESNKRYEAYANFSSELGGAYLLGFYTILLFFIYTTNGLYKKQDIFIKKLSEFYALGVMAVIPVLLLGSNPSGPLRLLNYFNWTLVLILPYVFCKINIKFFKLCFCAIMLVYFYLIMSKFGDLTPYTINPAFEFF